MRTRIPSLIRCTNSKWLVLFAVALLAMAILPAPASAQTCIQDEFNSFNGVNKTLSCTANDVSVAAVKGVTVISGGTGSQCFAGSKFSFIADFEILTTSSKTRSNIGIFFGTAPGATQALTGACSQAILSPQHPCAGNKSFMCGDAGYEEKDGPINGEAAATSTTSGGCGDTTSGDTSVFGSGTQSAELEVDGLTCPTNPAPCPPGTVTPPGITTCMPLPVCTSWFQPTTTMPVCTISPPSFSWVPTAIPGTTSKCSCGTLFIPVQPVKPSVTVGKTCSILNPTPISGVAVQNNLTTCDAGKEGNTVTYTVKITNTSSFGGVVIDQICDSAYGNVSTASGFTPACPAGSVVGGTITSNTCPPSPNDITTSGSCTFTVAQGENKTVPDTVTVNGHSDTVTSVTFTPSTSNGVTVTSEDAPSLATTTKNLDVPPVAHACVNVNYHVTVLNGSAADEIEKLDSAGTAGLPGFVPALHDSSYGDITHIQMNVLGTTCGVAVSSPGLGTLSGVTVNSTNGGAFPAFINPGSSYDCEFQAQFCGDVNPNALEFGTGACSTGDTGTPGTCTKGQLMPGLTMCTSNSQCDLTCPGVSNSDSVTANLTGDEGEAVSQNEPQFNVTVCQIPHSGPE